ncbi:MAG TPA: zinc-dependent metalloprotease [Bryobacteraceae bacterium]|nr:zinc-dependent metalloprotease [Bryobacteraceae bacterium]
MNKRICLAFFLCSSIVFAGQRAANAEPQTFAARTANLRKIDGFVPLYWDEHTGKMWLEISRFDQEFLYITALSAGVGSNDLGLDRGNMSEPVVVQFERSGPRILLIESNYRFRATGNNPAEKRATADSFARSTLWGFEVASEEGGRVLVDATNFFLRDAAHVAERLQRQHQGQYRVDPTRSAFYLPYTKAFPRNTEVETTMTFTGEPAGNLVREVTPSPDAITVREHQSFVALPEPGYKPRLQDPRAGYFSTEFMDFSAPIDRPVMTRYIARHRLEKKDPNAPISDPVEPIVYYVDPGAPADIRAALIEGTSWWSAAFEAAGFRNAFQVKVLPPDADPMDVRYHIIQWVHRSTRGWSYGNSLVDPRTGEIIKGAVSLGSLREHQDYLIFEGLLAPHVPGQDSTKALTDAVYMRLRQLAAHEVGHTLGLEHNYIASTANRASVMDYPGPWIELRPDNTFDLSNAYTTSIGEWDKVAITWGYSQFASGADEKQALDKILMDAAHRGLTFITDADSRPPGSAHPKSHLWDNGGNAVDELTRLLKIRSIALSRFGENNIQVGAPMATLDEVLVPLYFLHRYQTEAASKSLGGLDYTYAVRGDGQLTTQIVAPAEQRRALKALLETIDPATLTIPASILKLIPPRPPGYPRTHETFPAQTGLTFDPLAGAEAGADLTVSLILNPQRAARLVQYHAENAASPGLDEVIQTLVGATWHGRARTGLEAQVARTVNYVVLTRLVGLAADESAPPQVRSIAIAAVERLKSSTTDAFALELIGKFERNPKELSLPKLAEAPPGQPIGEDYNVRPW